MKKVLCTLIALTLVLGMTAAFAVNSATPGLTPVPGTGIDTTTTTIGTDKITEIVETGIDIFPDEIKEQLAAVLGEGFTMVEVIEITASEDYEEGTDVEAQFNVAADAYSGKNVAGVIGTIVEDAVEWVVVDADAEDAVLTVDVPADVMTSIVDADAALLVTFVG
ncbi:MAG: hypothetical protein IKE30_06360 [Clostridia bacterium]|nr:hypothetical protein [Clostridia bacterium]